MGLGVHHLLEARPRLLEARPRWLIGVRASEHLNRDIVELTFVGSDLRLQPTALHPLWSLDRDGWVRAGELSPGERLKTVSVRDTAFFPTFS